MYQIIRTDELYHHGILGMKWGVRRYQNKDGSLTPEGEKRYDQEGVSKVYEKSKKKLDRYAKVYERRQNRANRRFAKAERKSSGLFANEEKAQRAADKGSRAQKSANRIARKGKKFYEAMVKTYNKAGFKMDKETINKGQQFVNAVNQNSIMMYQLNIKK